MPVTGLLLAAGDQEYLLQARQMQALSLAVHIPLVCFGFAFQGFSFFLEAIFIAIYVYAWDRISPGKHLACGVVVVITGITGSLMVIAVNGWMNHPSGFRLVDGKAVDVHPWSALFGNE